MSSQLMQYSSLQRNRPQTASPLAIRGRNSGLSIRNGQGLEQMKRFRSDFPNLPGFSKFSSLRPQSPKNQSLNFKNGYMIVNSPIPRHDLKLDHSTLLQPKRPMTAPLSSSSFARGREVTTPNDVSGRYSLLRQRKDRENNQISLPFCPGSPLPSFLEHDRRVLLFNAYYEEDVLQSAIEDKRLMKCEIFFYVEDGTIEIIQTKQENSGIPQGVFLRRKRVEKPIKSVHDIQDSNKQYYGINDLKIGNDVEIYSRVFRIVDCNQSTKEYVKKYHGWQEVDVIPLPFPRDSFAEEYKEKMRRESGVAGVDRKRKMHDLKEVMESMLGKQLSTTDRGAFLERGQQTLCFHAIWDDRQRLYGDIQYYRLFYFLADDTIEILPIHKKNDGRYPSPKLLKRMKLPKNGDGSRSEHYSWKDLCIGKVIDVFGRSMLLAKCDSFTRAHYKANGLALKDNLPLEPKEEKIDFIRQIPPYNGFGSEEDSLRSCTGGINPPPVKRDLTKLREKQGIILRFNARLLSDKTDRRFVIQYFMEDDTIAIQEPPIRNSGVMGGKFLSRQEVKKHDGTKYLAGDMYTGNIVDIMCHHFELLNTDEYSFRIMENDSKMFPYNNYSLVREKLQPKKDEIIKYFAADYRGPSKIDLMALTEVFKTVGLDLKTQEVMTLWRKIDKKKKNKVSFTKLVNLLENDGGDLL